MTSKKNIILIIVIVVVMAAAVLVLYYGFGGSPATTKKSQPKSHSAVNNASPILPHGSSLDFSGVKKFNPDSKLFNYSTVTPDKVGVDLSAMTRTESP